MNERLVHTCGNIKRFLLGFFNRKFLIFLFFLVLSGIFWLMMTLDETYEQEITVPIALTNVPENVVITTDMDSTLRVTVSDKGYTLAGYIYGRGVKRVNVNFHAYASKGKEYGVVPAADLQKLVYRSLVSSSKVVSVSPDKAEFYYNYGSSKSVPVVMSGSVETGKSYYLAQTRFRPQRVTVYASKEALDSIRSVKTEELHITNLTDTVVREVRLAKTRGMKCVPSTVSVSLYPDVLTEESIEVSIRTINVPEGVTLRTFPSRVKVSFIVGAGVYRNIKEDQFDVVADYSQIAGKQQEKCGIKLVKSPTGVRSPRIDTKQVDYLIEQQ